MNTSAPARRAVRESPSDAEAGAADHGRSSGASGVLHRFDRAAAGHGALLVRGGTAGDLRPLVPFPLAPTVPRRLESRAKMWASLVGVLAILTVLAALDYAYQSFDALALTKWDRAEWRW